MKWEWHISVIFTVHRISEFVASGSENWLETTGCWKGVWASMRSACCGPPVDLSCFDMQFDEARCCRTSGRSSMRETGENCLPFDSSHVSMLLSLSVGVDAHRLSTSSKSTTCTSVGWVSLYALLRMGPIEPISRVRTWFSEIVTSPPTSGDGADGSQPPQLQVFHSPLRPLLLCVPEGCVKPELAESLSAFVAEHTLPSSIRPGRLLHPRYLLLQPLLELELVAGANANVASVPRKMNSTQCRSCAVEDLFSGLNLSREGGIHLPAGSSLVIDIGAHACTDFFGLLKSDHHSRHWVVAVEPDPDLVLEHPVHPRLSVLEAAIGDPGDTGEGRATLHRGKSGQCNSLFPFPEAAATPELLADCFTRLEPVDVRILSLATLLGMFAQNQEVDFLKIDAQGNDMAIIISAGVQLRRVRWIQIEAIDLPQGHPYMPYGPKQPGKEDIVLALASRGFLLDACRSNVPEIREENCLFVRADILNAPPTDVVSSGAIRWDRP